MTSALTPPPVPADHAQAQLTAFLVATLPSARFAFVGPMPMADADSGYAIVAESDAVDGSSVFHVRGQKPVQAYTRPDPVASPFDIALPDTSRPKALLTFFGDGSTSTCTADETTLHRDAAGDLESVDVLQADYGPGAACAPLAYHFTSPLDVSTVTGAARLTPHYASLVLEAERRGLLRHDGSGRYSLRLDIDGLVDREAFNCGHDVGRFYGVVADVDVSEHAGPGAPIRVDAVRVEQVKPSYCRGSVNAASITVTTAAGSFTTRDSDG
jgi:hypothetical protein